MFTLTHDSFFDIVRLIEISNALFCGLFQRCPPSYVSDLFLDLRDGSVLIDLLEVMSCQSMVSCIHECIHVIHVSLIPQHNNRHNKSVLN